MLTEFCQEITLFIENVLLLCSNNPRDNFTHGHHQMVYAEIGLIIFFAADDRESLKSQQEQDLEKTVAQVVSFLLHSSDLN